MKTATVCRGVLFGVWGILVAQAAVYVVKQPAGGG